MSESNEPELDPRDEELIARLVREDDAADAGDRESAGGDPRVPHIRELQRRLDALGAVERRALETQDPSLAALEERVERAARQRLAVASGAARPRGRRPLAPLSYAFAAVLLLGLGLWLALFRSDPAEYRGAPEVAPDEPYRLSGEGPAVLRWRPLPGGLLELEWEASDRTDAVYEVRLYDRDPADGGALVASSGSLDAPRWNPVDGPRPVETALTTWPNPIWVEVREDTPAGVRVVVSRAVLR
ncbi:MAG: hypothetical protein IPM29_02750 [Planctomycetes bacterium]|nr:hypothetical protein [Planctomycetota bacterium]